MTQTRFHNYKRPVTTFEENRRTVGIIGSGRYAGFDTFTQLLSLTFSLDHTAIDGIRHISEAEAYENYAGVYVTPQGLIIKEDATITSGLTALTNAANAFERIDAIVATHEWNNTIGGNAATYSVIKGADGGPVYPDATNPQKQTILGYLHIPASASNLSSATYEMAETPGLGNKDFARRDLENLFTKTQTIEYLPGGQSDIEPDVSEVLTLTNGNTFLINNSGPYEITKITSKGVGTEINLIIGTSVVINHSDANIDLGPAHGDGVGRTFSAGSVLKLIQVGIDGDNYGVWKLISTMGLDNQLLTTAAIYFNGKAATSDLFGIGLVGDANAGNTTLLLVNAADTFETNPRTIYFPKRSGRIPVYTVGTADVWADEAHDAGDYTSVAGSWAVSLGNLLTAKYQKLDKTLMLSYYIDDSVTSGSAGNTLRISLPNGYTVNGNFFGTGQIKEGSTYSPLIIRALDGLTRIDILKSDNSNFTVGTLDFIMLSINLQVD